MDAWETLLDGSTLTDGDAWEHLNAQGGSSGDVYIGSVLSSGVELALSATLNTQLTSTIDRNVLSASVATKQTADITTDREAAI